MLLCPVRNCRLPLRREDRRLVCDKGHSFDIARTGYINLLQPQERRSKNPGDTLEAVMARGRLHGRGLTAAFADAIAERLALSPSDTVLDVGCGEGFYLGALHERIGFDAHGIDISIPAIATAARAYPACEWIVGNADRFLPYADRSFSAIMSITARMNATEFSRAIKDDGRLLIAIPSTSDLVELRGPGHDRSARVIEELYGEFDLIDRHTTIVSADLDESGVEDVRLSIYRPNPKPAEAMTVTFSLEFLTFAPANKKSPHA